MKPKDASLERAAAGPGRRRAGPGHGQRADGDHEPVRARRVRALREVQVRARIRQRRADPGARARARRRLRLGRALPPGRVLKRGPEGTVLRRRIPRHGRHRARDAGRGSGAGRLDALLSAGRGAAARQRDRARVSGRQGRLRGGEFAAASRRVLGRRPPVALLRRGALLPRPRRMPARATSPRRAATCARSSSRPTRTASRSSSTAATSPSRTWPTWRWAASPTSRASTTTPTTSTSACPTTPIACPTPCSRRPGRCSRRGSTRRRGAFLEEFDHTFPGSPLAPDVMLLHAMIDLKSCQFDDVRQALDEFVERLRARSRPQVAALLKDPASAARSTGACSARQSIGHAARSHRRSAQGRPAASTSYFSRYLRRSIARPA